MYLLPFYFVLSIVSAVLCFSPLFLCLLFCLIDCTSLTFSPLLVWKLHPVSFLLVVVLEITVCILDFVNVNSYLHPPPRQHKRFSINYQLAKFHTIITIFFNSFCIYNTIRHNSHCSTKSVFI